MKESSKNRFYTALIFLVATVLMVYFMPRDNRHKYSYEENRPWSYSLLTAPFDITVYRDSATVKAMVDSVDQALVPIFRRDIGAENRAAEAIQNADSISPFIRSRLVNAVRQMYARGIVDQTTASQIERGALPEVKFTENNINISHSTKRYISQRDAYAHIDSMFADGEGHRAVRAVGLSRLLQPNMVEDKDATRMYRETLIQPIVSGVGVIQKGERIIAQGDIVTPQLYQILRTYETTLDKRTNNDRSRQTNTLVGQTLFVVLLLGLLYGFSALYYPRLATPKELMALMMLLAVFFVSTIVMGRTFTSGIYIMPLTIVPVIISVFYDSRAAFFIFAIEVLLCSVVATFPLEFIFIELTAGTAVLFSLKELSRRSQLLRSAAVGFIAYVISYMAVELMTAGSIGSLSWKLIGFFAVNAVLISFAYILIFVFEKLSGMVSVVTLVELCDINNATLRELSQECPGTFQHSMAVSNLATEAAHRIGANVQLVRAGALYHDIGKIDNPAFFTENQYGVNPHDALTPQQSARIIIRHITDGLRRGDKIKLPRVVKDFITQHHGKGKAKYFYNTYCRQHPDEEVDEAPFTYPGPNPQTREASLLMMADTVEAASRSMTDHSQEAIRSLVDRLIDAQVADGLHNESSLSFRDIKEIKECFISRLRSMYHARVQYPDGVKAKPADGEAPQQSEVAATPKTPDATAQTSADNNVKTGNDAD